MPGNLPLYKGYAENEMGHGEIENLVGLADFLEGEAVGRMEGGRYEWKPGAKLKELAGSIAADYEGRGITEVKVKPLGTVVLDKGGISNSLGHYMGNRATSEKHKRMVTDAFEPVPDALQKGVLVGYGSQVDDAILDSYIYLAPVEIRGEKGVMAVRVRKARGQRGKFYLHGVEVPENIKKQSRESLFRGSGLDTGKPYGANTRDVFRIAKKAFAVKEKNAHLAK